MLVLHGPHRDVTATRKDFLIDRAHDERRDLWISGAAALVAEMSQLRRSDLHGAPPLVSQRRSMIGTDESGLSERPGPANMIWALPTAMGKTDTGFSVQEVAFRQLAAGGSQRGKGDHG
jgi:hypothetical protein